MNDTIFSAPDEAGLRPKLVTRCKWCIERIGHERYFLDGVWEGVFEPHRFFGQAAFSDGICPECLNDELSKLDEMRDRSVVDQEPHKLPVAGSIPAPATILLAISNSIWRAPESAPAHKLRWRIA